MILKKRDIEFFWESANPDFHMQISFSLCILLCSRFPFHTWTSPIINLLCPLPPPRPPPQFCVGFVFNSLGCYSRPKENWRHCSCKIFGEKQSVLREMCKWRIMLFDLPKPYSCCLLQIACRHYPGNQYIQVTSAADTWTNVYFQFHVAKSSDDVSSPKGEDRPLVTSGVPNYGVTDPSPPPSVLTTPPSRFQVNTPSKCSENNTATSSDEDADPDAVRRESFAVLSLDGESGEVYI